MLRVVNRIRRFVSDTGSYHNRIARGFLWVSFFVVIGKLAGAGKEMAVAWRYGVSEKVDAYVFIVSLVNWPVAVWFSVLSVILIPLVIKHKQDDASTLQSFGAEILGLTLVLGAVLAGVAWWGIPVLLASGWVGFSEEVLEQAFAMVSPLVLLLPIGCVVSLFSVWMMACGRHRNTLLEALPALAILVALVLPIGWIPEPLVWGTLGGTALQLAGLGWYLRRAGELHVPVFAMQSSVWLGFWGGFGIMVIGQVMSSFAGLIDQFFAANLGEGAVSTLSYANRILALILGIGAAAIGRATLPIFSEARVTPDVEVKVLAMTWAKWMFIAGLGIAVFTAVGASAIVELLFERGEFTSENTRSVAAVFSYSLFQIPFYFGALVLVSALASGGHYALIALSGVMNLFIKVGMAYLLVRQFQLIGLVLATSAMYASSAVLLYFAVRWSTHRGNDEAVLKR